MDSVAVAGFLFALTLVHAAIAAYCLGAYARSRKDRATLVFGLLNAALVAYDGGLSFVHAGRAASVGLAVARAGVIAAAMFVLHYVLHYARIRRPAWALALLYGALAIFEALNALGYMVQRGEVAREIVWRSGIALPNYPTRLSSIGAMAALTCAALIVLAIVALARAWARGRREGPAFAGVAILGIACFHDAGRWFGLVRDVAWLPFGFAAFVFSVVMTLLSRFASLRDQLELRAGKLGDRSRELTRAYEELRAAQDALVRKEQLAVVGELAAVVAHEVRNPLAIITTSVANLRREGLEPADRTTLLEILDEESSRLNRIVGDLLRYARPIALERQSVALRELTERALVLAHGASSVVVEIEEREPVPLIAGDPHLLRQVFENLITNAVQAMSPSGGTLTVTFEKAQLDGTAAVEVCIEDTGEGMNTQVRRRALDPFFTTRPAGTGLGLAIVARIVDAHGGLLEIVSAAEEGTTVRVRLPVATDPVSSRRMRPERRSSIPPPPSSRRQGRELQETNVEHRPSGR